MKRILNTGFYIVTFLILLSSCTPSAKDIKLSVLFSDNMVIQREQPIKIYGKASPRGKMQIAFSNTVKSVTASKDSSWEAVFEPLPAGGPFELKIFGIDTVVIKNIMIGDIWLCSGQSNMEYSLGNPYRNPPANVDEEIANAKYPNIRLLKIEKIPSSTPESEVNSKGWKECSPESVLEFSAVGYFFGRELKQNLDIPIGLIQSAWGGTPIQPWMSKESLEPIGDYKEKIAQVNVSKNLSFKDKLERYMLQLDTFVDVNKDKFLKSGYDNWYAPEFNVADWNEMKLPERLENGDLGDFDGIALFRKEVNIPASMAGKDLVVELSRIDDVDFTYFNGTKIGYGKGWNVDRTYTIPANLVKAGKNHIAVLVVDLGRAGGLRGSKRNFKIKSEDNEVSLVGKWKYIGMNTLDKLSEYPKYPDAGQFQPTVLYNGMIASLINFPIKGVIWYQGESNEHNAYEYRALFPALINDWRNKWQIGEFPFLFVQLANFQPISDYPVFKSKWAEVREAQLMTLSVPNTGMAVAIDIGEADNIHPSNKVEVGRRLSLAALHNTYGKDIEYSGPIYKSMEIEGDKVIISFDFVYDGLQTSNNDKLKGFAIAGSDKHFVWANAVIEGSKVIVSSPEVTQPVAVRYAWAINPVCNLYNSANLPASPFRTDDWKAE